jgi:hypothetical protein
MGPTAQPHLQFNRLSDRKSNGATLLIAALYVELNGCYAGLPDVDPWPIERDARNYAGLWGRPKKTQTAVDRAQVWSVIGLALGTPPSLDLCGYWQRATR